MIELKYNGQYFELYPATRIPLEINNPIFDEDFVSGSYSFPFKMPLTPRTRRQLGMPDELNNIMPFPRKLSPVHLIVDGIALYSGTLVIRSVTLLEVDSYLLVGNSAVNDYASNTKVADKVNYLRTFTGSEDVSAHMLETTKSTVDQFPYVFFPVCSPNFYPGTPPYLSMVRTMQNFYLIDKFVVREELGETGDGYQNVAVTPFPYLTYLLRECLKGYNIRHNIFELDKELQKLVLYNNVGLAKYTKEQKGPAEIWVNSNDRAIDLKNHIPADISISDLLIGLKNIFCLYFYTSLTDGAIEYGAMNDLLARPVEINWTSKSSPAAEISNDFLLGLKYVPDYKGDGAADSLVQSIKGKKILPYSQRPLIPDPSDPTIYYYEANDQYSYADQYYYLQYSSSMTDYYLDEAEFEIKPRIMPLLSSYATVVDNIDPGLRRDQRTPYIVLPGKFYDKEGKINEATTAPRITFYRGYQVDSQGTMYPYGSSNNSDFIAQRAGNYSLAWDGESGLRKKWWDRYLNMRRFGRKVKKEIRLNLADLATLDLLKKVRIENANYIIKKINVELPLKGTAKVELWKTE